MSRRRFARGYRWGLLTASLVAAEHALRGASGQRDMLDADDQRTLDQVANTVRGLIQRIDLAMSREAEEATR